MDPGRTAARGGDEDTSPEAERRYRGDRDHDALVPAATVPAATTYRRLAADKHSSTSAGGAPLTLPGRHRRTENGDQVRRLGGVKIRPRPAGRRGPCQRPILAELLRAEVLEDGEDAAVVSAGGGQV